VHHAIWWNPGAEIWREKHKTAAQNSQFSIYLKTSVWNKKQTKKEG